MTSQDPNHALIVGASPDGGWIDRALEGAGFRITRADNPFEAALVFDEIDAGAALVYVDPLETPDLELLRTLRRLRPSARIVAAFERDRAKAARALELGADAILPEPFYLAEAVLLLRPREIASDATSASRESAAEETPDAIPGFRDPDTAITEALEEFAGGVAHEINNPLTVVAGWVEVMLREEGRDAASRARLASILEETRRIERVVGHLRAFGRVDRTPFALFDLEEELRRAVREFASSDETTTVDFDLDIAPDLPRVRGDAASIRDVMLHLFRNAATAAEGRAAVHVEARATLDSASPSVRIVVRDRGPGIPPSHRDRLFRPFFSGFAGENHAGLGLAACRGILRRHGGTLRWLEHVKPGAAFEIVLPADPDSPPAGSSRT